MKIDRKEEYIDDILSFGEEEICCYLCSNYIQNADYKCLAYGNINSLVSISCDGFKDKI